MTSSIALQDRAKGHNAAEIMVRPTEPTVHHPAKRLDFIDALRGIAATAVLLQHCAEELWPAYFKFSIETVRPGQWGVFVFFMVSGLVIPLSLKRETSVIGFWIGRAFRLLPLYWFMTLAAFIAWKLDAFPVSPDFAERPTYHLAKNFTMVQEFLHSPNLIGAAWSLAYEMVFYLFITIMFVAGLMKSSTKTTIFCLTASVSVGLLVGPTFLVGDQPLNKRIAIPLAIGVTLAVALWSRLENTYQKFLVIGTVFVAVGLTLNQPRDLWFTMLLFATMACGWVYHSSYTGAVSRWVPLCLSATLILITAVQLRWWVIPYTEPTTGAFITWKPDALTMLLAHLFFALAFTFRNIRYPSVVMWLGRISYSSYLMHAIVIRVIPETNNGPVATLLVWVAATLFLSTLTYYLIELPAQRLGRSLRQKWKTSKRGLQEIASLNIRAAAPRTAKK